MQFRMLIFFAVLIFTHTLSWGETTICNLILDPDHKIHIAGKTTYGRVRTMNRAEYIEAAKKDALDPRDFIVIDQFPTEAEPQVVAGILSGQPFAFSHMNGAADKAQIPLIYSKNIEQDFFWKQLQENSENKDAFHTFEYKPDTHSIEIQSNLSIAELKESGKFDLPKINAVPIDQDFSEIKMAKDLSTTENNRFGEKITNLIRATKVLTPQRILFSPALTKIIPGSEEIDADVQFFVPHFGGIPAGIYLNYLKSVQAEPGITLYDKIFSELALIQHSSLQNSEIAEHLQKIRDYFDKNEIPEPLFSEIYSKIKEGLGTLDLPIRFRSSNDVEDSLGSGIYDSTRSANKNQISQSIRNAWKSVFNYRAFQTRQLFSLDESNTALPLMFHLSFDNLVASGTGTYREYYGDKIASFITYPAGYSATNPEQSAKAEELTLINKGGVSYPLGEDPTQKPNWYFLNRASDKKTKMNEEKYKTLHSLFSRMHRNYRSHDANPTSRELGFEWLLVKDPGDANELMPIIVQVKEIKKLQAEEKNNQYRSTLTPELISAFESLPQDAELTQWLGPDHQFANFYFRHGSDLQHVPFYFIEVDGKHAMILGQEHCHGGFEKFKSHLENLTRIETVTETYTTGFGPFKKTRTKTFEKKIRIKAKILEMGRFLGNVVRVDNKIMINKLQFYSNNMPYEYKTLREDAHHLNLTVFKQLLQNMVVPGLVEFAEDAIITSWDAPGGSRYFGYIGSEKILVKNFLEKEK